jgi:hypothetical protein
VMEVENVLNNLVYRISGFDQDPPEEGINMNMKIVHWGEL